MENSAELAVVLSSKLDPFSSFPTPVLLMIFTAGAFGGGVLPEVGGLEMVASGAGLITLSVPNTKVGTFDLQPAKRGSIKSDCTDGVIDEVGQIIIVS